MMPKGSKHSEATKQKLQVAQRKRFQDVSVRRAYSENRKKRLIEDPTYILQLTAASARSSKFKGHKHSEESKKKIGDSQRGLKRSKEFCEKLSKAFKGKKVSDESRLKMSESQKRNYQKPEIKIAVSKGQKRRYERENERLKSIEGRIGGFWYGNVKYYDGPRYCEKFNEDLKERVRAFFNYTCFECGTPQNGEKLHIHHVWYNKRLCCDDTPRTLVPLCKNCHPKTNFKRETWSNHFQEIIESYYNGECWLSRDEMEIVKHWRS